MADQAQRLGSRLYLPLVSARPSLAPLFGALGGMQFYHFDSRSLRQLQAQSSGAPLGPSGEHLGRSWRRSGRRPVDPDPGTGAA
jgi:hypothetical protein